MTSLVFGRCFSLAALSAMGRTLNNSGLPHVDVFQMWAPLILRNFGERTERVLRFLKQHKITLAMPMGFVSSETCGQGTEGFDNARGIDAYQRLVKVRGVERDYITMDEPLVFGHDYWGKNACNFGIPQLATIVAHSRGIRRSYYPHVKFVLSRPPQLLPGAWRSWPSLSAH